MYQVRRQGERSLYRHILMRAAQVLLSSAAVSWVPASESTSTSTRGTDPRADSERGDRTLSVS